MFGIFFVAGVLGLAALPPLGAFPGKALVEEAAIEVGYGWVTVVLMLATVLASVALLRAGARVFFGWGPPAAARTDPREPITEESELAGSRGRVPGVMFASAAVLIVGGLFVAARPGAVDAAQRAATDFADRATYAADRPRPRRSARRAGRVRSTSARSPSCSQSSPCSPRSRSAPSCSSARGCRSRSPPRSGSPSTASFERLRRQHSGQTGDYVAWATVGFALLGALIALAT